MEDHKHTTLALFPVIVHFKQVSMANIMCMKTITRIPGARVYMDTDHSTIFILALNDENTYELKQFKNGLYYLDINEVNN